MAYTDFDPGKVLGIKITELSRKELCELACGICRYIKEDVGPGRYRGGVYPENISLDDEGNVALGKGKSANWGESELGFLAPELFWKGEKSVAADVYSVGMLLYYAASGGKLPFSQESEGPVNKGMAQQRRMNGEKFAPPASAGRRLGDIISKATAFKAHERYQSMDELIAVLESCVKNLYLNGAPNAQTIFKKSDDELSDIERMMIGIIEKEDKEPEKPAAVKEEKPQTLEEAAEEAPQEAEEEEAAPAEEAQAEQAQAEEEDVRLYVPEKHAGEKSEKQEFVPTLTEEKNPELAPVSVERPVIIPAVQYGKSMERERKINEEIKRRKRRPVVIILVLCALLIVVAIIFNAVMKDKNAPPVPQEPDEVVFAPQPTPTPEPSPEPVVTEEPVQVPTESTYQLIIEDVSWTQARDKCMEMGGHLAVVSTAEEFNRIVELAEEHGVRKLWLGCHRIDGQLIWETTEQVDFYQWAPGEPSVYDWNDDIAEDYLLLWYHNGWYYNDSRNDPVADYPEMYRGQIAYVCEFDGR